MGAAHNALTPEVAGAGWALERGGLHAVEHLLITLCPLLVHTEPNDLKCQCTRCGQRRFRGASFL